MPVFTISEVPVNFPYDPYDVQIAYMEKVIACLRDGSNGVLESPTGTGKTLSLLCSTLAWILSRKADVRAQLQTDHTAQPPANSINVSDPTTTKANVVNASRRNNWGVPKVIYASRTHSQLTQAMQELKRTAYSFMRAVVLGSRDQLCIHPEVMREKGNSNKISMCKLRVQTKTCSFHSRVESRKDHPDFRGPTVMDIEDLVKVGQKLKMCPYFASKELVADADITFMPYNYLLDPKARKANKVELNNTIIILDEGHNIEKICEESASVQIKSSDVAVAIEDVTHIMKDFSGGDAQDFGSDESKDFSMEDLALLKEMLLDLEKTIDDIVVDNKADGATFPAGYMFELLSKANFTHSTAAPTIVLLDKLVQFLMVGSQNSMFRKGRSFEVLSDLLAIVFVNKEESFGKVFKSFKLHVQIEDTKQQHSRDATIGKGGWLSKASSATSSIKSAKILNYWCFNPGFGMEQLLNKNVRSIILTSGTLAPLKPLTAELGIPVAHFLENPHIVSKSQVFVKIIASGPDREQLISNYANRDNPKYISSLGQTVLNVARIVPDGLLVFFPSYPVLNKCTDSWQASGLWADISRHKPIYVEPQSKDEFTSTMEEFYQSIRDSKGACFIAVCRGKVSEGLDFADRNGRAVIITGLPFPPLKDPKIILKKRYLEDNRTKENELLSGQAWYGLEATRAVNQAIGRVIRHRNDYGAILLCDVRFQQPTQVNQLSKWIRGHLDSSSKTSSFGAVVRDLREFFKQAEQNMPKPKERSVESLVRESCDEAGIVRSKYFSDPQQVLKSKQKFEAEAAFKVEKTNSVASWSPDDYTAAAGQLRSGKAPSAMDFMSRLDSNVSTIDFNNGASPSCSSSRNSDGLVGIHKRERACNAEPTIRQKRYKLIENPSIVDLTNSSKTSAAISKQVPEDRVELLRLLRSILSKDKFAAFTTAIIEYKRDEAFEALMRVLLDIFGQPQLHYLLLGMRRFLKTNHKEEFDVRVASLM